MDSNVSMVDTITPNLKRCALQDWVMGLPLMQQSVLLTVVRGPDGIDKYHVVKYLVRWYRRCILMSALDGVVLSTPYDERGGSFTGPSYIELSLMSHPQGWWEGMDEVADNYIKSLDALPHHFSIHFLHATEILGYKHPDTYTREWWARLYVRLVEGLHLHPESEGEMDRRLGDNKDGWLERADPATQD